MYVLKEWAVEPLKQLRADDVVVQQRLVDIEVNTKLNVILLRVEGETSRSTMSLTMAIYESGIVHIKCHNASNTWEFQVDDVVGELNLKHVNIETQVRIVESSDSLAIILNG